VEEARHIVPEKLFVIGLFEPENELQIRWQLS